MPIGRGRTRRILLGRGRGRRARGHSSLERRFWRIFHRGLRCWRVCVWRMRFLLSKKERMVPLLWMDSAWSLQGLFVVVRCLRRTCCSKRRRDYLLNKFIIELDSLIQALILFPLNWMSDSSNCMVYGISNHNTLLLPQHHSTTSTTTSFNARLPFRGEVFHASKATSSIYQPYVPQLGTATCEKENLIILF